MGNLAEVSTSLRIEERIITIRGRQVMLDKDLAQLYGVETKRLNEQVKRNIERFPEDFMFRLTSEECLRSQIATLNTKPGQHLKYMPYAFTENGIAMLSSVLRSETAIAVNIQIMRTFTKMRRSMSMLPNLQDRVELIEYNQSEMRRLLLETTCKVDTVLENMNNSSISASQGIFFDGQIYDAYTFVAGLVRSAGRRIILIDNYIDDTTLTLLDKRAAGVTATIYTGKPDKQLQLDIGKHNAQYPHIEVKIFTKAHDRFLIIDNQVYLIGASIKDLGKKWFGFTLMENTSAEDLIARI